MARRGGVRQVSVIGVLLLALSRPGVAQAPAAPQPTPGGRGGVAQTRMYTDMLQLMRGVFYPLSNVIFTAQADDPATIKPSLRPSTSPDPLAGVYGGWQAVELAALGLAEATNLLLVPGRACGNGRRAPVQNADWQMWAQEVRDSSMTAYKAAQMKSQDAILEAAGAVADACLHCHQKYRQVPGGFANRCEEGGSTSAK